MVFSRHQYKSVYKYIYTIKLEKMNDKDKE